MIIIAAFVWLMCCGMTLQASAASGSTAASARVVSGGKWVQTKDGRMYRYSKTSYAKNGWRKIKGKLYYFNKNGICRTGWFTNNGNRYYANRKGRVYTKKWLTQDGSRYYFQTYGACARNKWLKIGGKQYYFTSDGKMAVSRMIKTGGKCYFVDASGVRVKSAWVSKKDKRYFFDNKGVRLQSKWLKYRGKYYYFGSNGVMAVNQWIGDYYVGADGARMTNCVVDGYQLDANGKRVHTETASYVFVGDSRTVGMEAVCPDQDARYIAEVGMGYDWLLSTADSELREILNSNPQCKVIFGFGINDLGNISRYISYYQSIMQSYPNTRFYVMSVNPVNEKKAASHGYSVKNSQIKAFNKQLKAALGSSVYINTYQYLKTNGINSHDGVHYTASTYAVLYNHVMQSIQ